MTPILIAPLMMMALVTLSSAQPSEVILTLEASPGTEQAIGLIRSRDFHAGELAGVVGFARGGAHVLQGLTGDHGALDAALRKAGIRIGGGIGPVQVNAPLTADLVAGIKQSCQELIRSGSTENRRAVILLFGSDDPGLGAQIESVKAALGGAHARLYAIVIDRSAAVRPNPGPPQVWTPHFPTLTAQLVSEMAKTSGGKVFTRNWDIKQILNDLRKQ